jgi:hypothetical protein
MKSIKTKRSCPFCFDRSSSLFGTRDGAWLRCRACRSVFRDITVDKFEQLHGEACQDSRFVDSVVGALGLEPATRRCPAGLCLRSAQEQVTCWRRRVKRDVR